MPGEKKRSTLSLLHLISLFSQQGQELRKPPSKGFHTASAQKPKDLTSSKPSQMYCEEQMGSEEEEELLLKQHFPAKLLPEHTGAGKTHPSCSVPCRAPSRDAGTAETGTTLTGSPSGAASIPGMGGTSPARSRPASISSSPQSPRSPSRGVLGTTHRACRAPPRRGPCCAGSA